PIVSPVTLDQLFGQVGLATFEGANVVRHLRSGTTAAGSGAASGGAPGTSAAAGGLPPGSAGPGSGPGTSGLPASALAGHRKRLRAFLSSAKPGPSVVTGMENLMLVSESAGLSRATRTSYLDDLDRAVDGQLDLLSLPPETVTLTSHTGKIPITVVSHAPYPIHAILEVSSDKLSFPGHGRSPGTVSTPVVVTQRQTPVYFKVQARARGEFPLSIWLYSSHGHLLLLSGQFAVRSSGISGVAIGLTVAAGAVLAAWWGRTLLKGRQKRNRRLVPTGH
ncbi:MAG: DUF6049 family protein, partial [Acidimicrobiales bacterium]